MLAAGVYAVTDTTRYTRFVDSVSFFSSAEPASRISAQIGSRLICVDDYFAVCAKGEGEHANELFVIFRGSTNRNNGVDWLSNARAGASFSCNGCQVHAGFNQIFSSMSAELAQYINSQSGVHTVHCIGHSLGGAVANLCAEWVSNRLGLPTKLYTFGAPRVGLGIGFSKKLESSLLKDNIYRVYHSNDPVPMVPPFPYFHAPLSNSGYYLGAAGATLQISSHSMENYSTSVGGHSWSVLYQPAPGLTKASIESWLTGEHDNNPNSVTFWHKTNAALTSVVQLIAGVTVVPYAVAGLTVVDGLAMILRKGIDLAGAAQDWVMMLMKKLMRAAHMKVVETVEELTTGLIRSVFERLLSILTRHVAKALQFFQ